MHHRLPRIVLLLVALSLIAPSSNALAQTASPVSTEVSSLDLAAIALTPDDVPDSYFDEYSEWWVPPGAIGGILGDAPAPDGLLGAYQSFFISTDSPYTVNTFLLQFDTPDAALAGASSIDAGLRPQLPEGSTTGPTTAPGPEIGDSASTLTSVSFDTREAGGPFVGVVASSFVHDTIVGVVSIEAWIEPPAEGSPIPAGTPEGFDAATQTELATQLAAVLDARIGMALAGEALSGVDPSLSERTLPLQQLVSADTPVLGGYKAGADLLQCRICGEENSLGAFAGTSLGGFVRMVSAGPMVDGEPSPPFVGIAVSEYATPADALAVLDAIRIAPNDLPTAYPLPRGERTIAADPAISGADGALAYTAILDPEDATATPDSAGVTFTQGSYLVSVDVQGGLTADQALAVAVDLATQQAACLASTESCASVTLTLPAE